MPPEECGVKGDFAEANAPQNQNTARCISTQLNAVYSLPKEQHSLLPNQGYHIAARM